MPKTVPIAIVRDKQGVLHLTLVPSGAELAEITNTETHWVWRTRTVLREDRSSICGYVVKDRKYGEYRGTSTSLRLAISEVLNHRPYAVLTSEWGTL